MFKKFLPVVCICILIKKNMYIFLKICSRREKNNGQRVTIFLIQSFLSSKRKKKVKKLIKFGDVWEIIVIIFISLRYTYVKRRRTFIIVCVNSREYNVSWKRHVKYVAYIICGKKSNINRINWGKQNVPFYIVFLLRQYLLHWK